MPRIGQRGLRGGDFIEVSRTFFTLSSEVVRLCEIASNPVSPALTVSPDMDDNKQTLLGRSRFAVDVFPLQRGLRDDARGQLWTRLASPEHVRNGHSLFDVELLRKGGGTGLADVVAKRHMRPILHIACSRA
jgi:hypothetical protein